MILEDKRFGEIAVVSLIVIVLAAYVRITSPDYQSLDVDSVLRISSETLFRMVAWWERIDGQEEKPIHSRVVEYQDRVLTAYY